MIISINADKASGEIYHPFMIFLKTQQTGNIREIPQLDKEHQQKPTANTILKW